MAPTTEAILLEPRAYAIERKASRHPGRQSDQSAAAYNGIDEGADKAGEHEES